MKKKLNDLIYYIGQELIENGMLNEKKTYDVIKEFLSEMCENQKLECYANAELEDDSVDYDDNGNPYVNWIVKESSIMECKNVADEL